MNSEKNRMRRREFLNVAAAGTVLLASAPAFRAAAKGKGSTSTPSAPASRSASSKIYVCDACGHVEFGSAPEFCPVCHTEERFSGKDSIFSDAMAKLKDGSAKHTPVIRVQEKSTLVQDSGSPTATCTVLASRSFAVVQSMDHRTKSPLRWDGASGYFLRYQIFDGARRKRHPSH